MLTHDPFPHARVQNVLPKEVLCDVLAAIPAADSEHWRGGSSSGEGEEREGRGHKVWAGPPTGVVLAACAVAAERARSLVDRWDVDGLELDTSYGGIFQMMPGTAIAPHRDKTRSPRGMERRWAGILFLTTLASGSLMLWHETEDYWRSYLPHQNELVVWEMGPRAFHSVSRVGPQRRCTLAFHLSARSIPARPTTEHMEWRADVRPTEPKADELGIDA